ncbi:hypothetical protein GA0070563_106175 [Micromonospora carbonacea]|uniref:Uncharacterized protein n=1 Tax=Micromonospora carbonacea TaxID=47853 RepID=A0A1C4YJ07_9ACTN|nr:hypothetical protein GA0070563_106175 [Micromonospora carbonacea]
MTLPRPRRTTAGVSITTAIPPVFDAYATTY